MSSIFASFSNSAPERCASVAGPAEQIEHARFGLRERDQVTQYHRHAGIEREHEGELPSIETGAKSLTGS